MLGSLRLILVGQFDKDIFETGRERANFRDGDALLQELCAQVVEIEVVFDQGVNRLAKDGGAADD